PNAGAMPGRCEPCLAVRTAPAELSRSRKLVRRRFLVRFVIPRLQFSGQPHEILPLPQRVEARILYPLSNILETVVDCVLERRHASIAVGINKLLLLESLQRLILLREFGATRQEAGGVVGILGRLDRGLEQLIGGRRSRGVVLQVQERLGQSPAV